MINGIIKYGLTFLAYIALQVLVLEQVAFFNVAFCLVYVSFILCLPFETRRLYLLFLGFGMGIIIDLFSNYPGLHASALLVLAFLRNFWFDFLKPPIGYESGSRPSIASYGFIWFITYASPLVFVHHLVLFFTEAAGFHLFWHTMLKVVASTFITMMGVMIIQYLGPRRRWS